MKEPIQISRDQDFPFPRMGWRWTTWQPKFVSKLGSKLEQRATLPHVSYSLSSLKEGMAYGTIIGVIKGDARSLDYGPCSQCSPPVKMIAF